MDKSLNSQTMKKVNWSAFFIEPTCIFKIFQSSLLSKLQTLRLSGIVKNWIRGFLRCCKQQVRVDSEASSWKDLLSRIPQGSVLGPTLFVIFINVHKIEGKILFQHLMSSYISAPVSAVPVQCKCIRVH